MFFLVILSVSEESLHDSFGQRSFTSFRMTFEDVQDDIPLRHAGTDHASFLLQGLGRIGAGGAEGLPEDGGEGNGY